MFLRRESGRCYFCGITLTKTGANAPSSATRDHLTPKSRGGDNSRANVVPCCRRCNGDKGNMTEAEYVSWVRDGRPAYGACGCNRPKQNTPRLSRRIYKVSDEAIVAIMAAQIGPESNAARTLAELEVRRRQGERVSIYVRGVTMFVGGDDAPSPTDAR